MRLLLDTHALLWLMNDDPRLNSRARGLIDSASEVYVSSASVWEIAIKARIGKIEEDPEEVVERIEQAGLRELPVSARHAVAAGKLPLLHRDPFDRLLVAQAMIEGLILVTGDRLLLKYGVPVLLV